MAALLALATLTSPASAETTGSSSAYAEKATVSLLPLLGGGVQVSSGPTPQVSDTAPPAYDLFLTTPSITVTLALAGNLVTTGVLTSEASSDLPAADRVDSAARVDETAIRLAGLLPLLTLGADLIESESAIVGPCGGSLTPTARSRFVNSSVGGALGAGLTISANPAPNTVLLDVAGVRVVLNEQSVTGDGIGSLAVSVNAIHITLSNALVSGRVCSTATS